MEQLTVNKLIAELTKIKNAFDGGEFLIYIPGEGDLDDQDTWGKAKLATCNPMKGVLVF